MEKRMRLFLGTLFFCLSINAMEQKPNPVEIFTETKVDQNGKQRFAVVARFHAKGTTFFVKKCENFIENGKYKNEKVVGREISDESSIFAFLRSAVKTSSVKSLSLLET